MTKHRKMPLRTHLDLLNEGFIFWHIVVDGDDDAFIAIVVELDEGIAQNPFQKVEDQDEDRTLQ